MEKLFGKFVLSVAILAFLMGCKESDLYADLPPLRSTMHIFIEYYDMEEKGYKELEGDELKAYQKERMTVEVLSFKDDVRGITFMEPQKMDFMRYMVSFSEMLMSNYDKGERHYSIKYKSFITGDSVEEIKVNFGLFPDHFKKVWYNNKEIPVNYDYYWSLPDITIENWHDVTKETFYNGDIVAVPIESVIYICIPMVKQ